MKFLLFAVLAAAYTTTTLLQINDSNFKQITQSGKWVFVDFYADWCRHCKKLMPVIEELAQVFADYDDVQVVKINGDTDGKKMSKKYVPVGYPTMLLFHGTEEPVEYDGSRDLESISNFVQAATGIRIGGSTGGSTGGSGGGSGGSSEEDLFSSAHDLNFDELLAAPKTSVVVFSASHCHACQSFWPVLERLAEIYREDSDKVQFLSVQTDGGNSTEAVCEHFGIAHVPSVAIVPESSFEGADGKAFYMQEGRQDLAKLVSEVNEHARLHRTTEGTLDEHAGRIPALDRIVRQFGDDPQKMLTEYHNLGIDAKYYLKLMNKMVNGEGEFLEREVRRLSGILEHDGEKLNRRAKESMEERLNILKIFVSEANKNH